MMKIFRIISFTFLYGTVLSNTSVQADTSTLRCPPVRHTDIIEPVQIQTNPDNAADHSKASTLETDKAITINANQVDYQPDEKLKLDGNVEIVHGPYRARSDQAKIESKSNQAELTGNIVMTGPDVTLTGDSATMDMSNNQVSINNARFSNPSTNINGEASRISQPDTGTLIIHDGLFTSCPPEARDWAFASEKITLNKSEGYGTANNTRFLIKDVPVLYIPWFSFPIDERRKTGFLYPTIGSSNTENGVFVSTPYYFNLAPDYDATLTPTFIHGRGMHTELELRYLNSGSDNMLGLGYIAEDKNYRDELADTGQQDSGERWGLSFKQEFGFESFAQHWHGQIDFNDISDNDYLDDLAQDLQIDRSDYLDRRGEAYLSADNWQFSILLQQYRSIDDTLSANEQAYQRLPEMNLQLYQDMGALHLDWQSQYVYFYRKQEELNATDSVFGSRLRHRPRISLPLQQSWGYLKPSATLDHTDYALQAYSPVENHLTRTVPIYELDSGLYFDRYARAAGNTFIANDLRQSIEPRLYYVYSEAKNQDEIPNFDSALPSFRYQRLFSPYRFSGGDRIGDNNRLTAGFTSRWTDQYDGTELATFSLGQIFHFEDRKVGLNGEGLSSRSDSLFASEITLRPFSGLELAMTGLWDTRSDQTQEGNSRVSFHSKDYQSIINFSHRFIRDELEQSDISVVLPIAQTLSFLGRWRYDIASERTIGTLTGVEYGSCCWRIQLLAQSHLNNKSEIKNALFFRFQLSGVGGFGKSANSMDKVIPGYKAREEYFN